MQTNNIALADLRLYNYVMYEGLPQQIVCIDLSGLTTLYIGESEYLTVDHNKISGIPITEEWLIKLGFEKNQDGFLLKTILFEEDTLYVNRDYWYPCSKELKYVHELQNAFYWITGTELTLK